MQRPARLAAVSINRDWLGRRFHLDRLEVGIRTSYLMYSSPKDVDENPLITCLHF